MPESFQASVDTLREKLKAELKLVELRRYEGLARLAETERWALLRDDCAKRYRALLGIDPSQREDLRQSLEGIRSGNGLTVDEIIWRLERRHAENGLSPEDGL